MITVNTVQALLVELTAEQFESLAFYTSCYSRKKYVATNDEVRIFLKEFVSPDEYNNLDNHIYPSDIIAIFFILVSIALSITICNTSCTQCANVV